MLEHQVLYTSDIHGNIRQFKAIVKYAMQVKPLDVIIGGDIAPKNMHINLDDSEYIELQRNFLKNDLPEIINPLKKISETNVFLMLGNDDCSINNDVLNEYPELYRDINKKRFKLDENHEIIGYSFVPITPFGIKDFEKFDLSKVPECVKREYEERKINCYRLEGIKSVKEPFGWEYYEFEQKQEAFDSIQRDLNTMLFTKNPDKTIYAFHSPPNNTSLDVIWNNTHVGSFAVREFIEKYNPKVTLHGHIHETVEVSGRFKENIGNCISISSGNHNYSKKLAVVVFNLYKPQEAQRLKIDC